MGHIDGSYMTRATDTLGVPSNVLGATVVAIRFGTTRPAQATLLERHASALDQSRKRTSGSSVWTVASWARHVHRDRRISPQSLVPLRWASRCY
jgi:hypothetical protein